MRAGALGAVLLAAVQAVVASDSTWVRRFTFHDPTGRWNMGDACAVSPSAGVLVYRREERPSGPRSGPLRIELVYVDFSTGQPKASLSNVGFGDMRLAISGDGRAVAIIRPREGVSIWRPFDQPDALKTYGPQVFMLARHGDRSESIHPTLYVDPAFSPDGQYLAYSGDDEWWTSESGQQGYHDALGILDLNQETASAIPLPYATEQGTEHFWYLAWSADGGTIWVTAHGPYESQRFERKGTASVPVETLPSDWTLFRCSVADRTATAVAGVPPSILGIDPHGDVIVSDVDRKLEGNGPSWWHRTAFGVIPLSALEESAKGGRQAAQTLALEAKTTKVVPAGGGEFRLERVFIGKSHTYVIGWLNKERVVLERASSAPQIQ
jgi:hypothetical protein